VGIANSQERKDDASGATSSSYSEVEWWQKECVLPTDNNAAEGCVDCRGVVHGFIAVLTVVKSRVVTGNQTICGESWE
jgi:hypothetical protein